MGVKETISAPNSYWVLEGFRCSAPECSPCSAPETTRYLVLDKLRPRVPGLDRDSLVVLLFEKVVKCNAVNRSSQ